MISERARDVVLDSNGNAAIYNGTFDPRLTTYDPVAGTFANSVVPFWSTGNNVTFGGVAALGDKRPARATPAFVASATGRIVRRRQTRDACEMSCHTTEQLLNR